MLREVVKIDATVLEQVNGVLRVDIFRQTEPEVELPCAAPLWDLASFIHQTDTQLNDFEQVDIAPQGLIVELVSGPETSNWLRYDARELSVHCYVRVVNDQLTDRLDLIF